MTPTIKSLLQLDEDALEQKSSTSEYWQKAYDFYWQVKDKQVADVSKKQMDWLLRISEQL